MQPQLAELTEEFSAATRRVDALARSLSPEQWRRRPSPASWSAIECIQHLNLTAAATLPRVRDGLEEARASGGAAPARLRRDFWGWLLWRGLRQPGRYKSKTTPAFVPDISRTPADIVAEFRRLQGDHLRYVRQCEGLPVDRTRIVSPFNERLHYSVYSALWILAVHQHRHLWQAEQAARAASV